MQNLEDLKEKIFFEAKNIIDTLSKTNSSEELLLKKDLIDELTERAAFLKVLEKNENYFTEEKTFQYTENEEVNPEYNLEENQDSTHEGMEEEVIFTNELNEIHKEDIDEEIEAATNESTEELKVQTLNEEDKTEIQAALFAEKDEDIPLIINEKQEDEYLKAIEEKERDFQELEEKRRKIVEFDKDETKKTPVEAFGEGLTTIQEEHREKAKKFKLANIKGLKPIQSLFDDDPLEHLQEEKSTHTETEHHEPASLLKTNVPTDYMEAEKPKPEFKLDLNDRIAFTKKLFNGSQVELNETIRTLNEFKTLEDAKEYLSDLYYDKNWKKADEYAQRLWNLVENKFM